MNLLSGVAGGGLGWSGIAAAVLVGAILQAATGFGAGLAALPVVAAVAPRSVPVLVLLTAVPLNLMNVVKERSHVNRELVTHLTFSRLVGISIGVFCLTQFRNLELQATCLFVATLSLVSLLNHRVITGISWVPAAGATSGFMAATAGVGGPPIIAILSRLDVSERRATAGAIGAIGASITLVALHFSGRFRLMELYIAATLIPVMILGTIIGQNLERELAIKWGRHALVFVVAVGCVVLGTEIISSVNRL